MPGENDPSAAGAFAGRRKRIRAAVLIAGPAANLLVAVAAFALAYATGWPDFSAIEVQIQATESSSPAEQAGLMAGDVVRRLNGRDVRTGDEFGVAIQEGRGEAMEVTVSRRGALQTVLVTPRTEWPEGQGPVGVRLVGRALPIPHGPVDAMGFGFAQTIEMIALMLLAPIAALLGHLPAEVVRPVGLPGMAQAASQTAAYAANTGNWYPILFIAGALSAGMGVVNLLPVPALDGGRLLFIAIEAVRRRRVSPLRERRAHVYGMAILLALAVVIAFIDIAHPPPPLLWGGP
jgi:regulator of sigma E protease